MKVGQLMCLAMWIVVLFCVQTSIVWMVHFSMFVDVNFEKLKFIKQIKNPRKVFHVQKPQFLKLRKRIKIKNLGLKNFAFNSFA